MSDPSPGIDPKQFWNALSNRACAAAVVTARANGSPAGFFALSVTHLTASPPTILVSVSKATSALASIAASGALAVNYLDESDRALADVFSGRSGLRGADRFDPARWETMRTGSPVLRGALGVLDCTVEEIIERHDTALVLARIEDYRSRPGGQPLVHYQGGFRGLRETIQT